VGRPRDGDDWLGRADDQTEPAEPFLRLQVQVSVVVLNRKHQIRQEVELWQRQREADFEERYPLSPKANLYPNPRIQRLIHKS
jgi:hypothetical protein